MSEYNKTKQNTGGGQQQNQFNQSSYSGQQRDQNFNKPRQSYSGAGSLNQNSKAFQNPNKKKPTQSAQQPQSATQAQPQTPNQKKPQLAVIPANLEFGSWYDTQAQNPKKPVQEATKTTEPTQTSSKMQKEPNQASSTKKEKLQSESSTQQPVSQKQPDKIDLNQPFSLDDDNYSNKIQPQKQMPSPLKIDTHQSQQPPPIQHAQTVKNQRQQQHYNKQRDDGYLYGPSGRYPEAGYDQDSKHYNNRAKNQHSNFDEIDQWAWQSQQDYTLQPGGKKSRGNQQPQGKEGNNKQNANQYDRGGQGYYAKKGVRDQRDRGQYDSQRDFKAESGEIPTEKDKDQKQVDYYTAGAYPSQKSNKKKHKSELIEEQKHSHAQKGLTASVLDQSIESPSKIKSQVVASKDKLEPHEPLEQISSSVLIKQELPQVQPVRSRSQKDMKNKRKKSNKIETNQKNNEKQNNIAKEMPDHQGKSETKNLLKEKQDKECLNEVLDEQASQDKSKLARHKLDPDASQGTRELIVLDIATKDRIIEVTVRENTNLTFLCDKISILGDFKSCPKKFKDIFLNYLRNEYKSASGQLKLQVIPPSQTKQKASSKNTGGPMLNNYGFQRNYNYSNKQAVQKIQSTKSNNSNKQDQKPNNSNDKKMSPKVFNFGDFGQNLKLENQSQLSAMERHNSNPDNVYSSSSKAISGLPLLEPKTISLIRERRNSEKSKSQNDEDLCTPQKLNECIEEEKQQKSEIDIIANINATQDFWPGGLSPALFNSEHFVPNFSGLGNQNNQDISQTPQSVLLNKPSTLPQNQQLLDPLYQNFLQQQQQILQNIQPYIQMPTSALDSNQMFSPFQQSPSMSGLPPIHNPLLNNNNSSMNNFGQNQINQIESNQNNNFANNYLNFGHGHQRLGLPLQSPLQQPYDSFGSIAPINQSKEVRNINKQNSIVPQGLPQPHPPSMVPKNAQSAMPTAGAQMAKDGPQVAGEPAKSTQNLPLKSNKNSYSNIINSNTNSNSQQQQNRRNKKNNNGNMNNQNQQNTEQRDTTQASKSMNSGPSTNQTSQPTHTGATQHGKSSQVSSSAHLANNQQSPQIPAAFQNQDSFFNQDSQQPQQQQQQFQSSQQHITQNIYMVFQMGNQNNNNNSNTNSNSNAYPPQQELMAPPAKESFQGTPSRPNQERGQKRANQNAAQPQQQNQTSVNQASKKKTHDKKSNN